MALLGFVSMSLNIMCPLVIWKSRILFHSYLVLQMDKTSLGISVYWIGLVLLSGEWHCHLLLKRKLLEWASKTSHSWNSFHISCVWEIFLYSSNVSYIFNVYVLNFTCVYMNLSCLFFCLFSVCVSINIQMLILSE